jgi:hypothetical protein
VPADRSAEPPPLGAGAPEPAPSRPTAEPVVAPPEALPPPLGLRTQEIEALVREAVKAETARQAAAPRSTAAAAPPAELAAAPAPPRPATAAEASVIGKLEPSTQRIMLFGVRRR